MEDILFLERKKTLANRTIWVEIKGKILADLSVFHNYFEDTRLEKACKEGCPNYGKKWSCPPFSKSFIDIKKNYTSACMICFSTEMKYYADIKNKYMAIKAANVTLKSLVEKSARAIEKYADGYSLLSGSCRLCKPCQCKINRPCKHPDKMRYSMEATALNVQKLCDDFLGHHLLWYADKTLPRYTSAVALVLSNNNLEWDRLSDILNKTFP